VSDERQLQDVDEAQEWLDSWVAGVDSRAEAAARLARQVAAVTAVAHNDDETITVTVGASGQVEDIDLHDRVQRLSGGELSRQILAVMRVAQRQLTQRVAAEVQATVGDDSETGRAVNDAFDRRFPDPSPEERYER
jgi:hypothetical protein